MKAMTLKKKGLGVLSSLLLLSACQQARPPVDLVKEFQNSSSTVLNGMVRGIYQGRARGIVVSNSNQSARGIGDYSSADTNGVPLNDALPFYYGYGGGYQADMVSEMNQCISSVQSIPKTQQNYIPMVAILAQCLDRVLMYRNPLMNYAYRQLSPQSAQAYWYLMNWRGSVTLPGSPSFSGFGNDYYTGFYLNPPGQLAGLGQSCGGVASYSNQPKQCAVGLVCRNSANDATYPGTCQYEAYVQPAF